MSADNYSREALNELRTILLAPAYLSEALAPLIEEVLRERIAADPAVMANVLAPAVQIAFTSMLDGDTGADPASDDVASSMNRFVAEACGRWAREHPDELSGIVRDASGARSGRPGRTTPPKGDQTGTPTEQTEAAAGEPTARPEKAKGLFGRSRLLMAGLALVTTMNLGLLGLAGWGASNADAPGPDLPASSVPDASSPSLAAGTGSVQGPGGVAAAQASRLEMARVSDQSWYIAASLVEGSDPSDVASLAETAAATGDSDDLDVSLPTAPEGADTLALVADEKAVGSDSVLYLTFDDGPNPRWTPEILNVLARHGAHATFFALGQEAAKYPELVRDILAQGHNIGHHSWDHPLMAGMDHDALMEQIWRTDEALGGDVSAFLRPPYGVIDDASRALVEELGLRIVLWDIDPRDWMADGAEAIAQQVLRQAAPGRIVVLHDGGGYRGETVQALEIMLAELGQRGYRFEAIPLD